MVQSAIWGPVMRVMLHTRWSGEQWSVVMVEFRKAVALRGRSELTVRRTVLSALNPERPGCLWISHDTLAKKLNKSEATAERITQGLRYKWDLIKKTDAARRRPPRHRQLLCHPAADAGHARCPAEAIPERPKVHSTAPTRVHSTAPHRLSSKE